MTYIIHTFSSYPGEYIRFSLSIYDKVTSIGLYFLPAQYLELLDFN